MLTIETQIGDEVVAGELRLAPVARSLRLMLRKVGLVWNRPVGVVVRDAAGDETLVRIRDLTRRVQLALLAAGVLGSAVLWRRLHHRREETA